MTAQLALWDDEALVIHCPFCPHAATWGPTDDEHSMHARMERHFATKHDELIARLVGRKPAASSTSSPEVTS